MTPDRDSEDVARVSAALARVPALRSIERADLRIERLGGLTNRVYRVATPDGGRFAVRIAGAGTDAYIDRAAEAVNVALAADLGLAPEVVLADPADGTLVLRWVEDAVPLDSASLRDRGVQGRVCAALRTLHRSDAPFRGRVELRSVLRHYRALMQPAPDSRRPVRQAGAHDRPRPPRQAGAPEPPTSRGPVDVPELPVLDRVFAALDAAGDALLASPVPAVPCHNDPSPGNLLDDGRRIVLVDWEHAALGDPAWDVAAVATEARLGMDDAYGVIVEHLGREPRLPEAARVIVHMAGLEAVGALWALVQLAHGNRAADFEDSASERLARAMAWVDSGALAKAVAGVRSRADR